jgi:hypothetical protein
MTALARPSSNCKLHNLLLVREGAPHQQTDNYLTVIQIWSRAPIDAWHQGRPSFTSNWYLRQGTFRERSHSIGNRYQAMVNENWKHFMHDVLTLILEVCASGRLQQLLSVSAQRIWLLIQTPAMSSLSTTWQCFTGSPCRAVCRCLGNAFSSINKCPKSRLFPLLASGLLKLLLVHWFCSGMNNST